MPRAARGIVTGAPEAPDYNLIGQRLGRKGRDTRERILAATQRLIEDPEAGPVSLSAVARQASLAMTTLYLYFSDLTELVLAVLEPVMASAEDAFVAQLRRHWTDEALGAECRAFIAAYHAFWVRNGRLLHLRNHYADMNDERMYQCRLDGAVPIIALLSRQMLSEPGTHDVPPNAVASVLLTAIERTATITTHGGIDMVMGGDRAPRTRQLLEASARLLELGIGDAREAARAGG